jgi:hypothetical protein
LVFFARLHINSDFFLTKFIIFFLEKSLSNTFIPFLFGLHCPSSGLLGLSFIVELYVRTKSNFDAVDVIHVHEGGWLAGIGTWLGERWGVPVICKARNSPALEIIGYDTPLRKVWQRKRLGAYYISLHNGLTQELVSGGIPPRMIVKVENWGNVA